MSMNKDFDRWNNVKKKVNAASDSDSFFPKERWVWICSIGVNVGYEQDGVGESFERPVLVIKKFNNKMFWVAPLSTKQKDFDFYYNFTDGDGNKVSVIIAQLRLISVKRFIRDMYVMEEGDFSNVISRLRGFLEKSEPRTRRGSSRPEGTL